jgi:hypothetical protein
MFSSLFEPTISQDLQQLSSNDRLSLLKVFWPNSGLREERAQQDGSHNYVAFLDYLGHELSSFRSHSSDFAAETFQSTAYIIRKPHDNREKPRKELFDDVKLDFLNHDEASVQRSIELTVRLWLTINVYTDSIAVGPIPAHASTIEWSDCTSLSMLDRKHFDSKIAISKIKGPTKLDQDFDFTAVYLVDKCRIRLKWTNNLLDHLYLDRRNRVLSIYQHKICLINHRDASECSVIPLSVIEETLHTLNLLFPHWDPPTRKLLAKEGKQFNSLDTYERQNDLSAYTYWKERLMDLYHASNERPQQ